MRRLTDRINALLHQERELHQAYGDRRQPILTSNVGRDQDTQRQRLVPTIGRGSGGGAIPGTRPDHRATTRRRV